MLETPHDKSTLRYIDLQGVCFLNYVNLRDQNLFFHTDTQKPKIEFTKTSMPCVSTCQLHPFQAATTIQMLTTPGGRASQSGCPSFLKAAASIRVENVLHSRATTTFFLSCVQCLNLRYLVSECLLAIRTTVPHIQPSISITLMTPPKIDKWRVLQTNVPGPSDGRVSMPSLDHFAKFGSQKAHVAFGSSCSGEDAATSGWATFGSAGSTCGIQKIN